MSTTALVQFSTGLSSAEVALIATQEYERVLLITADTLVEDADNWRFAREVHAYIGRPTWVTLTDGRTPMQVGRDQRCVPNNRMAVCSRILKRELVRRYLDEYHDPEGSVVLLGFDATEPERLDQSVPEWVPWTIRAPLMELGRPTKDELAAIWTGRGILPPRLYDTGAPHANCGGACVRGGQVEWRRLLFWNRDRYLEWEAEEEQTRTLLGKDVSILRDRRSVKDKDGIAMSLREFRERVERDPMLFDPADSNGCLRCV